MRFIKCYKYDWCITDNFIGPYEITKCLVRDNNSQAYNININMITYYKVYEFDSLGNPDFDNKEIWCLECKVKKDKFYKYFNSYDDVMLFVNETLV